MILRLPVVPSYIWRSKPHFRVLKTHFSFLSHWAEAALAPEDPFGVLNKGSSSDAWTVDIRIETILSDKMSMAHIQNGSFFRHYVLLCPKSSFLHLRWYVWKPLPACIDELSNCEPWKMEIATAAINKSLFDYVWLCRGNTSVIFDSSWLQLLHKPPQNRGKADDLVLRRCVENAEEDVSERVWGGVGRRGGQLDSVSSCWKIHIIWGTSHTKSMRRPPPHMSWSRRSVWTRYLESASIPSAKCVWVINVSLSKANFAVKSA